jgi:hypothetical protein
MSPLELRCKPCVVYSCHITRSATDVNMSHTTLHQCLTKSEIHNPNHCVHPWLAVPVEEVNKTHICISCSPFKEVDIFLYIIITVSSGKN